MTDTAHDMLLAASTRRLERARHLRSAERADAWNQTLAIGPGPEAITPAFVLRNMKPGTPRLNEAIAVLADPGYRRAQVRPPQQAAPPSTTTVFRSPAAERADAERVRRGLPCDLHQVRHCVYCTPVA